MRRFLAFLCLCLLGCSADLRESDAMFRISDDSGSLKVGLRGSDSSGKHYRLRDATFEISGTAMVTLSSSDTNAGDALSTPLPTGGYQVYLRPGHTVVEVRADGTEHALNVRLSSPNPAHLSVSSRADRQVSFSFRHDGGEIAFGAPVQAPVALSRSPNDMLARAP